MAGPKGIDFFIYLIFVLSFSACSLAAPQNSPLSNRSISVVMDNNYPPFSFLDENGNLQGILIDEWRLWEQKTGIKVHVQGMDWGDALVHMEAGEYDVIDTIFFNERRAKIFDFTKPYASIDVPIFFNRNISGISGPETARGFVIGVKTGDNAISVLKNSGVDQLLEFNRYEEIIKAARDGRVMVFCIDKPPALYYLYKLGLFDQFYQTSPIYSGEFHRAVLKGNTGLLKTVENGFSLISPEEKNAIEWRWYGTPVINNKYLTYIAVTGLIVILLIIILLVWNYALQKNVTYKTKELKKEIELSTQRANALAKSERFLSNIVENIPDMIFVKDAQELRVVRLNKAGEDLLGYSREELHGCTDQVFFSGKEADLFCSMDTDALMSKSMVDIPEEVIQTRYRGQRILHTKKIPILDENGEPEYLLGISEDITEQKKVEESLNKALKKLNLLNSIVFTDIQNKLYSLFGFIELQTESATDEKQREYLLIEERLIRNIQHLLHSTKDYQDLGMKVPKWHDVLHSFLLGISHLPISHLTRHIRLDNLEVFSDPLLEMVFFHLVDNIVKHGENASNLTLIYEENPDGLVIIFEDNGIGIPDSEKDKIFERTGGNRYRMGLFLVKEILGITGIGIQETGMYGKGARFEILVPKGGYRFSER
jgi:PAS domain S-box-containing protein